MSISRTNEMSKKKSSQSASVSIRSGQSKIVTWIITDGKAGHERQSRGLLQALGEWLYLDMDVVVTGSLDPFFEYERDEPFIVMQNWTQPEKGIGNTSCRRFRIGNDSYLRTAARSASSSDTRAIGTGEFSESVAIA